MKLKRMSALLLCGTMLAGTLAGCSGSSSSAATSDATAATAESTSTDGAVTIKVFSNLTDRTSGQGLIEQTLFDSYMEENPNVTIEVEALDDESYKTKFKAYATGGNMPDLVNIWCSPSFLDEVVAAGTLEPLNADDYADYGFTEGSLDGVTYDGQIYGLPRNTDVLGFYYNKDLFEANGVEVPTTWDELLAAAQVFQDAGISPIAMDGQDKWPLAHFINCMIGTVKGTDTYATMVNSVQNSDYSDPAWKDTVTAASEQASLLFQPENWSKLSWENGVCMSAQDFSQYLTGNETDLQNDIINALNTASGTTGMTYNDLGDSAYKTLSEDSTAEVLSGMISVDDFFTNLQNG
jgi:raffinose/stachyose/melibiose transport system substrate-binding protein